MKTEVAELKMFTWGGIDLIGESQRRWVHGAGSRHQLQFVGSQ